MNDEHPHLESCTVECAEFMAEMMALLDRHKDKIHPHEAFIAIRTIWIGMMSLHNDPRYVLHQQIEELQELEEGQFFDRYMTELKKKNG